MHDQGKSDSAIVAVKPSNKAGTPAAEAVEPRAGTKGNADQQSSAPDSEPGARDPGAGPRAASARAALPSHTPEVGAGCSNRARPDLCGGRPAMNAPTANLDLKREFVVFAAARQPPKRVWKLSRS